jgi:hypothetical protein
MRKKMNPTKQIAKTLLTTSIAAVMAVSSAVALAQASDDSKLKTYTDPITGELKIAPRLLSEMSEAEKAALSAEETKFLEDIEAQVNKREKEANE